MKLTAATPTLSCAVASTSNAAPSGTEAGAASVIDGGAASCAATTVTVADASATLPEKSVAREVNTTSEPGVAPAGIVAVTP